jgi:hypothetical protein
LPLKCLAISTKRYALYNEGPNGEPIIRKASAHGLGAVGYPQDYDPTASPATAPEHIAAGLNDEGKRKYHDLVQGAGARFFLDFWRIAIKEFEDWIVGNLKGVKKFKDIHDFALLAKPFYLLGWLHVQKRIAP